MYDRIRALREQRGWSQQELARRAGVSRQLLGAVESGRHVPNVAAALALARALGATVEALFAPRDERVVLLGDPPADREQVVVARVGDQLVGVPLSHGLSTADGWGLADAVLDDEGVSWLPDGTAEGIVAAGCDPLLGLLAALVSRTSPHRIVVAHASTADAVAALAGGRVHAAVVHGPPGGLPEPPVPVQRWHLARWQVGLASSDRPRRPPSLDELVARRWPIVQRHAGAGSQQALDRALAAVGAEGPLPGPVAGGHVDVARCVAAGVGRAGLTMEAAAAAFQLDFTPLEEHIVELWVDARWSNLAGVAELVGSVQGPSLAARARALGGYDLAGCGSSVTGQRR